MYCTNVYCTDDGYVHIRLTHFTPSVRSFIRAKHAVILLKQCDNQPAAGQNRMLTKCFLASMCVLMFVWIELTTTLRYINFILCSKFPVCTFSTEKCANNRFNCTNNVTTSSTTMMTVVIAIVAFAAISHRLV